MVPNSHSTYAFFIVSIRISSPVRPSSVRSTFEKLQLPYQRTEALRGVGCYAIGKIMKE
jgi:hypothetical protein